MSQENTKKGDALLAAEEPLKAELKEAVGFKSIQLYELNPDELDGLVAGFTLPYQYRSALDMLPPKLN